MSARELITDHLDLWTDAVTTKSTAGRGRNGKIELTGIKKLRELILDLAVRGKLVDQDPSDEPASVLLERIAEEKARLVKEGKIKKPKKLPEISEEEKPFELPEGWLWARMKAISEYIQRGKGPKYADFGEVRVVSQKCIQWSGFDLSASRFIDDSSLSGYQGERYIRNNDILWNSTGTGTVGRAIVAKNLQHPIVADSHVTIIRPLATEPNHILNYIASPSVQQRIGPDHENSLVSGTTKQVELNSGSVKLLAVPLPPLEEQHRIVEKVDELMALCDRLEQQVGGQLEAHEVLVDTLLDALTRSADASDVADNWARITEHFDTLFTTEASIDKLKNTLLQLAVTGRITEQNQEDEPAEIAYGKKVALPEGYIRKTKQKIKERPATPLETLPSIPPNWAYFSIDKLYSNNHLLDYADGNHGSLYPRKGDFGDEGVVFLTAAQITDFGEIKWSDCPRLSSKKANKLSKGWSQKGDVFFTHNATVGRTGLASAPPEDDFLLGTSVTFYRVNSVSLNRYYLYYYFSSPIWQNQAAAIMQQTTRNQVSITKQALFYVSLPPLNEQRRVVERVQATLALCDQLTSRLREIGETRTQLAEAVVEQAVS
ncbi:restriction endonuclease subunit S [Halomonas sp. 25-S5]|uniref:restriction endonuclease subunit S n=1 Tax=Halomonas sp. 25-S5 TaxID=2994065 RepID=UPI00246876D1|nr:restriction endonuclease subunit S [Halomonas sp. 25-S5]